MSKIKPSLKDFIISRLNRKLLIKKNEIAPVCWSFLYFFSILSSYYLLRPLREEMGITGGIKELPWLFSGTFIAMLLVVPAFGYITRKFSKKTFMPLIYYFFSLNILIFFVLFKTGHFTKILAPIFFIWISVFNLFIISVFWSFMSDIFSKKQSLRLFGIISSGGSLGAITGPAFAAFLSHYYGYANILLVSAIFLIIATICIKKLFQYSESRKKQQKAIFNPIKGNLMSGVISVAKSSYLLGICGFIFLYSTVSTFLYFEQAHLVKNNIEDPSARTALFASIDLITNILCITIQVLLTNRFIKKYGLPIVLSIVPFLVMLGFIFLGKFNILSILIIVQVIHRAGNFSLLRPGKEMLFTTTTAEEKYKAKNFMDTFIYRGGDAITAWSFTGLSSGGFDLSTIALITVPFAFLWMINGYFIGNKHLNSENKTLVPINIANNNTEQLKKEL